MIPRPGCDDSAVYECVHCGAVVCPDCEPSPGEGEHICSECRLGGVA